MKLVLFHVGSYCCLVVLPIAFLKRNVKIEVAISKINNRGFLIKLPSSFQKILYPRNKLYSVYLFGLTYKCLVGIQSMFTLLSSLFLYLIVLDIWDPLLYINGKIIVLGTFLSYIVILVPAFVIELITRVYSREDKFI